MYTFFWKQDAVQACTEALLAAAAQIEKKQGNVEGTLFLVMHLLKLREQARPLQPTSDTLSLIPSETLSLIPSDTLSLIPKA